MRNRLGTLLAVTALLAVGLGGALNLTPKTYTGEMVHHDVSAPLRDLEPFANTVSDRESADAEAVDSDAAGEAPQREGEDGAAEEAREKSMPRLIGMGRDNGRDAVLQATARVGTSATVAAMPSTSSSFDGLFAGAAGPRYAPPDTTLDAGTTQLVEIVNSAMAVYDKATGATLWGPKTTNTLWSGFGGLCETTNDGDPTAVFDRLANRWVVSQFAYTGANGSSVPYLQCVAVSTTDNAQGTWYRYSFAYSLFPDYPKLSVWPDAYYTTFNMFSNSGFSSAFVCAYERVAMLAGQPARQACYSSNIGSILVATVEGSTPPPVGTQAYGIAMYSTAAMRTWRFAVDWSPTTPVITATGPTALTVANYTFTCSGGGGVCVPQLGTTNTLDTLGGRLMYRYVYRNLGASQTLVVSHSVSVSGINAVRWYQLTPSSASATASPTIAQQGTYQPDSNHRWMPSISIDQAGNIGMVYSISSSARYPGIAATGRLAGDTANLMTQGELQIVAGGGSQTGTLTRWGDYAAAVVDPVDDCTFWVATEYLPANGTFNWRTRIASFKFPSCGGVVTPTAPSVTSNPQSTSVASGSTASFSASATGSPTPTVQWESSSNGGSTWTPISGATANTYSFTAFVADSNKQFRAVFTNGVSPDATSSAATLTVTKANSTTSLTVTPNPVGVNQTVTMNATVANAGATGTVTFKAGATDLATCTLSSGTCSRTTTFGAAGTNSITAVYSGDTNYNGSTSAATSLSVIAPPSAVASVTLATGSARGSIRASWSRPNGSPTSYTVTTFNTSNVQVGNAQTVTSTASSLTLTISGLTSRQPYYVKVVANNVAGSSGATQSNTASAK